VSVFSTDAVSAVLNSALDGVSFRQNVIANNIANVDTPDFRATSVDFESSLRAAIADGNVEPSDLAILETPTDTPVGANGNNVDLRKETMAAMQSTFQYQILSRATNERYNLIKTAAAAF
jgi:flagellar basal-body rod protein FlgB